ncbi:hypothetical protein VNO77_16060 [Canavalia gladiata]|uniref:Uncharacterized protein n=1 Tax=Canavalia gladiata TaxID=3824 RepID=A0AAN9QSS7_CANGL
MYNPSKQEKETVKMYENTSILVVKIVLFSLCFAEGECNLTIEYRIIGERNSHFPNPLSFRGDDVLHYKHST